jgi:primosomal protein N' (replication factor Y) (superfamily II helicase)
VRPDVPAVDRAFDYLVPDAFGARVEVGTIVRVPLHGRRVRGWVVADGVEPEAPDVELRAILAAVSAGPPPDVVELCGWAAWRWAGPATALLRTASPPNVVAPGPAPEPHLGSFPPAPLPPLSRDVLDDPVGLVAWPPAADRRALVTGLLADTGSTIVVVPEGTRLGSLVRHLEHAGRRVVVLRGDQPDAIRTAAWVGAREGACVVVGGRVAVLAPVPDLAAIVVLDEGDEALKEERVPAWHARDLGAERARRAGARLALVGPVPTVDACVLAGGMARPDRGIERRGWPRLERIDLRDERPDLGMLTAPLARALHDVLDAGARAVCVLNRKGRARLLACAACGELVRCETCGAAVAEEGEGLSCPRCGAGRARICDRCGGTTLRVVRAGVTRVRDDLAHLLPRAAVAEVDASTDALPDADVLIGTEAVLHRVRGASDRAVGIVAFLEFDQELLALRYRAGEQALALLARAGRVVGPEGRLLVQTRVPEHEVLEAVAARNPEVALTPETDRRRSLGFPPFGGLAEVSGVVEAVESLAGALRAWGAQVLGPSPGRSGSRALVRTERVKDLCEALAATVSDARRHGRIRVEVDPLRV